MPTNDRDVWNAIVSVGSDREELNFLTYAIYSFEKFEWSYQNERQRGRPPTEDEINEWISQITESRIKGWREKAARAFDVAVRVYYKDRLSEEREKIFHGRIENSLDRFGKDLDRFGKDLHNCLLEFKKSSSFSRQMAVGFFIAVVSPIILGLIIFAVQAADSWPTASDVFNFLRSSPVPDPMQ